MATLSLDRITKRFGHDSAVVDDISLEIFDREFLVLVGPSGCGKSTTLRMIAGLETCTAGNIRIGGSLVNDVAPKDRDVAMVFQNYALYSHLSVYGNLSFGLTLRFGGGVIARGLRKFFQPRRATELAAQQLARLPAGIDGQVRQTATRLGIEHLLDRMPHQLSGGERQRVALGRAIVRNPAAFLLDEPLSNLDAKLRQQLRTELRRLHGELQATWIYVTHDQVEAMTLGDRIAVMNEGRILQVGRPLEVYQCPANLFVARFIGSVPMNLISGTVQWRDGKIEFTGGCCQLVDGSLIQHDAANEIDWPAYQTAILGFRAEDVALSEPDQADFTATVTSVDRLGESTLVHLQPTAMKPSRTATGITNSRLIQPGLVVEETELTVRLAAHCKIVVNEQLGFRIDRKKILWFDPLTGQNLRKENHERQ